MKIAFIDLPADEGKQDKIKHCTLPEFSDDALCFVLSSDSLVPQASQTIAAWNFHYETNFMIQINRFNHSWIHVGSKSCVKAPKFKSRYDLPSGMEEKEFATQLIKSNYPGKEIFEKEVA